MKSADVIHSFWVPSLAGKIDMIPGRTNRIRFAASEAGVYRGQCAEYCGGTHALMALYVVALAPAEFEAWLRANRACAGAGRRSPRAGRLCSSPTAAEAATRCAARPRSAPSGGPHARRRPPFARGGHLAQRARGLRPAGSPTHTVKPEVKMPSFGTITGEDLIAVAAYLEGLE